VSITHSEALFVLDGNFRTGCAFILAADEVGNLLVLSLLDGALVALVALAENLLLDHVDGCSMSCQHWVVYSGVGW